MDAWLAVMCFNTVEGGKKNLPKPASWADLANPVYKDSIVMPNPASSGTGYQAVYAWIQMMGEKAAWEFMDKLHQNIAVYTHSGSAPCVQAAKGERIIGIGFDMRGAKEKTGGAPIDIIMAKEGAPWDMEATAIMKGTKNLAAAQKLADFAVSKGAYELYGKYYAIVGYPGHQSGAAQLSAERRCCDGQDRPRQDGRGAREDPRRVDQALRLASRRRSNVEPGVLNANTMRPPPAPTARCGPLSLCRRKPQSTADAPYLRIEHLTKQFGAFAALKDISLEIFPRRIRLFPGPSGCGKTTLLRAIAGLDIQTSGRIFQADKEISKLPASHRDFGIVFQSYALFPNLTVAANIGYGLVSRGCPGSRSGRASSELLKLVGLPESGRKYPAQLSGGQQQRVAVARALALSPGLLLLDEPLSALDARVRAHLRTEIRSLHQRLRITTIMVTHDQEEALTMADRIVVMNQGVIEQVGTPTEVYRKPATAFVADFVGRTNFLPAWWSTAARALLRHRSRVRARHQARRRPRRDARHPARGRRRAQHRRRPIRTRSGAHRRDRIPGLVLPRRSCDQWRRSGTRRRLLDQHRARSR